VSRLHDVVRLVADDLRREQAQWALIGGLAVSARAEPRFTRDADVAVAVKSDAEAEALVRGLMARGYRTVFTLEQTQVGRLATVRLEPPGGGAVVDLLFASSGIEGEIVESAESLELVAGLHLPIASLSHLIALKILARDDLTRPQDLADLRQLLSRATEEDIKQARGALDQIVRRGYHRGRDLMTEFSLLSSGGT